MASVFKCYVFSGSQNAAADLANVLPSLRADTSSPWFSNIYVFQACRHVKKRQK